MGATYTRQSSYADGDTITAAHTNDEFNQLLAAFQASSGHTHDGTANEGGPITKMLGTSLTLGDATSGSDITVTFDGESNDGVLIWMEDEDYFKFSDDILMATTEKIQLRDTAIYLYSSADGQADLVADSVIQVTAPTVNIEASTAITLESDSVTFGEAGDTDIVLTFNANTSDGVLTWMEDEDYFKFSDDVLIDSTEKLQLRDTAIYLYSSADGQADLVADSVIQVTAPTVNIEASTAITLESDSVTFGENGDTDVVLNFNANTSDGVLTWMEDEDYFKFSDDVLINSTEKLYFQDTGTYIYSNADGDLDLVSDGTNSDAIKLTSSGGITLDAETDIELNANGADIVLKDDTATFGSLTNSSGELVIKSGSTPTTALTFSGANVTVAGNLTVTGTTTFNGGTITLGDADSDNIVFGAEVDSHIIPDDDATHNLGSSSKQWNDIYINGSAYIDGLAEDILVATNKKVQLRDTDIYLHSSADGQADLVADSVIQVTAPTVNIEASTAITLESDSITFGEAGDTDIVLAFNANTADGEIKWMEDEDYFEFSDDILMATTEKLQLRDTAIYLYSSADGQADLVADSVIQVTAPTVNVEASTAITLESDSITLGENGDTDVVLTFNANTADGVITWMEDEDYFAFSDEILMNSTEKILFGDTGTYIHQSADGVLDLVSDTELELNATTIDINGDVEISGATTQTGISTSTAKDVFNAGMSVKNGSTSAGFVEFFENSGNGTNKVTLTGPASTADITLTLPSTAGTVATTASALNESVAMAIALG